VEQTRLIAIGKVAAVIVIAVLLQVLLVSHVTVLDLSIDLFVIFTVIMASSWGPVAGAVFGFAAGIAVYVIVGYALGVLAGRLRSGGPRMIFLYTLGSSFAAKIVLGLFSFLMGPRSGFFEMLGLQMIPGAALDALFAIPVFVLLVKLKLIPAPRAGVGTSGEAVQ
jgi:ribose/xylose/arabinose/galactoside ABC-type transport system permease subunit